MEYFFEDEINLAKALKTTPRRCKYWGSEAAGAGRRSTGKLSIQKSLPSQNRVVTAYGGGGKHYAGMSGLKLTSYEEGKAFTTLVKQNLS